jgi:glycosyltransferase involved in cell wall biosynthesis
MGTPDSPPRLAVIVANFITGDSRVQKAAIAAARDGWDVTLIGRSKGRRRHDSAMGPIKVIRLPVRDHYRQYAQAQQGRHLRRRLIQAGIPTKNAWAQYSAAHRAWVLEQETLLTESTGAAALLKPGRRGMLVARDALFRFRRKAWGWEQSRIPEETPLAGDWRQDWPVQVDVDLAFVPILVELAPDVIHANDITMMSTAAQAVARLRRQGHKVNWLSDIHEYVRGVQWPRPAQAKSVMAIEREFIGQADAVSTVSPELAEILRGEYRLPQAPVVIRNAPIREAVGVESRLPSVRDAAGLSDDTPLLVYAGWVGPERGLGTAIDALPELPGVHFAIVAGRENPELQALLGTAAKLGVRDRVHVVPYVPQHLVPDYLSTADLGVICFKHVPNCEISLPTKVPEYLHARLPMVVSDVQAVRTFVEENGLGEVFPADDAPAFAQAVLRALPRRAELAAHITDELLADLSWERQADVLTQTYRRIAPRVPAKTRPDVPWSVEESDVDPSDIPAPRNWRPLSDTAVRLGLGPANYAGQAASFAQAITDARPDVSAEVFMYRGRRHFDFPADVFHDVAKLVAPDVQMDQVRRILGRYTHLIADGFRPVFGYLNGKNIGADLPMLLAGGVKVALLAHGSEVRHPLRHLERIPHSHFRDAPDEFIEPLVATAELNRRVAEESGLPVFVTTPDLLEDLPWATWTPLVVDVESWRCDRPVMERKRPRVLHVPSARWKKGSERVVPVLEEMDRRGAIELRLVEEVSWNGMREMVRDADVVIDQFTTGAYGTMSVEAMAAGRIAVAYLSDGVKQAVGEDIPILNTTPDTLESALQGLLDDRDRAVKIGLASVDFAHKYHSGAWTARVLDDFLR